MKIVSTAFAHNGALDVLLPDLHTPRKAALEKAMKGHVIATAELVGTYQKRR